MAALYLGLDSMIMYRPLFGQGIEDELETLQ